MARIKWIVASILAPIMLWIGVRSLVQAYEINHPQIFIIYFSQPTLRSSSGSCFVPIPLPDLQSFGAVTLLCPLMKNRSRNPRRPWALFFLGIILGIIPTCGYAAPLWDEQQIHVFTLKNGLTTLVVERPQSPTVALYMVVRAGAVDEKEGKTGTAHLLEHMMFKGTKTIGTTNYAQERKILNQIFSLAAALEAEERKGSRARSDVRKRLKAKLTSLQQAHRRYVISNEIDRLYTEAGGVNLNASTSHDFTCYHVSLPANKIALWARIESDRLSNLVFREFFEERDVVKEERRQRKESHPDGTLYEELMISSFIRHFYRRPVIGWMEDIVQIAPSDLEQFHRRFYAPNNVTLAVVGNVKVANVKRLITEYFSPLSSQSITRPDIPPEPAPGGERRVTLAMEANPQLLIAYHKPAPPHADDYVFDVLETILSDGRSSRLYKRLVDERGLAQHVDAYNGVPGVRYDNLFIIAGRPRDGHTNEELERAVYEILDEMKREDVTKEELQAAKNKIAAHLTRQLTSNEGMAELFVTSYALFGDLRYLMTYLDRIDSVKAADIRRVISQYCTPTSRSVGMIGR